MRRRTLARWSFAYATTVPALFVLSLAIAGLLGCLCQYILLKAVEKEVPALTAQVDAFADDVIARLNNASEQWAVGTNKIINDTNVKINDDVFGWVNTTTSAVNDTLNVFVDDMVDVLNITFGGTVLYTPILDVLDCLVLLKVQGIEKGLTWVSDNAYVSFPELDPNMFSLGAASKVAGTETDILATSPGAGAADEISEAVTHVTDFLKKTIRQETIISACILIVWLIIAFIGLGRAGVMMLKGGDEGVYYDPHLTGTKREKTELDAFLPQPLPRVPTYEQATSRDGELTDNSANKLHGQSYTLTPNPLPTFEVHNAASPVLNTGFSGSAEKLGVVNGQNVTSAMRRPTHIRASSHGDYALISPTSPRPQPSPYINQSNNKPNQSNRADPFVDPRR